MIQRPNRPVFRPSKVLDVNDLNAIAEAAFKDQEIDIEGGTIEIDPGGRQRISMRKLPDVLIAKVYKYFPPEVSDSVTSEPIGSDSDITSDSDSDLGSDSDSGDTTCTNKQRFSFIEQIPLWCGFASAPNGFVGDGIRIFAIEANDADVEEGTIQRLYKHYGFLDDISDPKKWIQIYSFWAGGMGGGCGAEIEVEIPLDVCLIQGVPPSS